MKKGGKSSGNDSICNEMLSTTKDIVEATIANLFTKIIEFKYFPKRWSLSLIVPIHKSGELDDPNNFRGISLNSFLSKLFTSIMNSRLMDTLEEQNLIDMLSGNQLIKPDDLNKISNSSMLNPNQVK